MIVEWKHCKACRVEKPLGAFHRAKNVRCGRQGICKRCQKAYRQRWYRERRAGQIAYAAAWKRRNPGKVSEYGRRHRHGLEPADYDALVAAQDGRCAICGGEGDLRVDHCPERRVIRGLLCDRCNRGAGFFDHDPERLERAAAYLRREGVMPHASRLRAA